MLFFIFKVVAAGLIVAFSSWLAGQNPKLAGFIIALPLVSLIAILFSYYEHNDTEKTVMFTKSVYKKYIYCSTSKLLILCTLLFCKIF